MFERERGSVCGCGCVRQWLIQTIPSHLLGLSPLVQYLSPSQHFISAVTYWQTVLQKDWMHLWYFLLYLGVWPGMHWLVTLEWGIPDKVKNYNTPSLAQEAGGGVWTAGPKVVSKGWGDRQRGSSGGAGNIREVTTGTIRILTGQWNQHRGLLVLEQGEQESSFQFQYSGTEYQSWEPSSQHLASMASSDRVPPGVQQEISIPREGHPPEHVSSRIIFSIIGRGIRQRAQ